MEQNNQLSVCVYESDLKYLMQSTINVSDNANDSTWDMLLRCARSILLSNCESDLNTSEYKLYDAYRSQHNETAMPVVYPNARNLHDMLKKCVKCSDPFDTAFRVQQLDDLFSDFLEIRYVPKLTGVKLEMEAHLYIYKYERGKVILRNFKITDPQSILGA